MYVSWVCECLCVQEATGPIAAGKKFSLLCV